MIDPALHRGLPVVVVGDVHGDIERLFKALAPYPAGEWHTVFLGDLVNGGPFGAGVLRYARDRPNTTTVLGNHEALMLAALEARPARGAALTRWLGTGGQPHDLDELATRSGLREWTEGLPLLVRLDDGTVVQHSDNDSYRRLAGGSGDPIGEVNEAAGDMIARGEAERLWDLLLPHRLFLDQPLKLDGWLNRLGAPRLIHGHSPHRLPQPHSYHGGRAINFDGGLGRHGGARFRGARPLGASVGPLPVLED